MPKQQYRLTTTKEINGQTYLAGDVIELDSKEAAPHLEEGSISPAPVPAATQAQTTADRLAAMQEQLTEVKAEARKANQDLDKRVKALEDHPSIKGAK